MYLQKNIKQTNKLGTVDDTTKIRTQTTFKEIKAATRGSMFIINGKKNGEPLKNAG